MSIELKIINTRRHYHLENGAALEPLIIIKLVIFGKNVCIYLDISVFTIFSVILYMFEMI